MTYPVGTPCTGTTNITTGDFTPLNNTRTIIDNQTSIDKASITNSVGAQLSLVQNYVNSTYLGRSTVPINSGFITNISMTSIVGASGDFTNLLVRDHPYTIGAFTEIQKDRVIVDGATLISEYTASGWFCNYYTGPNRGYLLTSYVNGTELYCKGYYAPWSKLNVDGLIVSDQYSSGILTDTNLIFKNINSNISTLTSSGLIFGDNDFDYVTVGGSHINLYAPFAGETNIHSYGLLTNYVEDDDNTYYCTLRSSFLTLSGFDTETVMNLTTSGLTFGNNDFTFVAITSSPKIYLYSPMSATLLLESDTISIHGVGNPGDITVTLQDLPTSDPSEAGRVWDSGGYLCISAG